MIIKLICLALLEGIDVIALAETLGIFENANTAKTI